MVASFGAELVSRSLLSFSLISLSFSLSLCFLEEEEVEGEGVEEGEVSDLTFFLSDLVEGLP